MQSGKDYQNQFFHLVKKLNASKIARTGGNPEMNTPKMNIGTIKKYLTETQYQILCLMKK